MLVDGYARDVKNNFAGDTPRFNPVRCGAHNLVFAVS
jgi:hypothetical protein